MKYCFVQMGLLLSLHDSKMKLFQTRKINENLNPFKSGIKFVHDPINRTFILPTNILFQESSPKLVFVIFIKKALTR